MVIGGIRNDGNRSEFGYARILSMSPSGELSSILSYLQRFVQVLSQTRNLFIIIIRT